MLYLPDINIVLGTIGFSVESVRYRSPHDTIQVLQEICPSSCHVPHGGQYRASYNIYFVIVTIGLQSYNR